MRSGEPITVIEMENAMTELPGSRLPDHPGVPDRPGLAAESAPLAAPGKHGKPPRRHRRLVRSLVGIGVAVAALVAAGGGYTLYLNNQITRLSVGGLSPGAVGSGKDTENILLVGSTSRCALTVQNPAYGLCSRGVTGVNSDVVMVLHLDSAKHTVSVLSIPRDTFVPNARVAGANKIDAALAEGPTQLVKAIQLDFGIPIQHYIQLNFETFADVVDALGGVKMYFPEPVYDAFSGLNVAAPGCQTLDGIHALQVVRTRHLQHRSGALSANPLTWPQEVESDLARIRRTHEFLRVMASAVAQQGLGNPITDERLIGAIASKLEVDSGLTTGHLASLALTFHAVNINDAVQLTLPIQSTTFGSYHYKGGDYGDIVWPSQPEDRQVIRQFLGLGPNTDTMTGAALPAPAGVTVAVLNGTGLSMAASSTAAKLSAVGFPVVHTGDTPSVGRWSQTVVYASANNIAAAQAVLDQLSGNAVLGVNPGFQTPGALVTVVTGTSFTVNAPASAAPTPTASSSTRTHPSSPTPTPSAPAVTAAAEPLASWDPRSCTAAGTAGP